jgi:hypothetical protein
MPPAKHREPIVPAKVKVAIEYMQTVKANLADAARHAGIDTHYLRRQMKTPHVRRYMRAEEIAALDAFCLGSTAALTEVRNNSKNGMAVCAAVRTGELLRQSAAEESGSSAPRFAPGLVVQIVNVAGEVTQEIGERPSAPLIDVTPSAVDGAGSPL